MKARIWVGCLIALSACVFQSHAEDAGKKKIVFIAGNPSHEYGGHEHNGGCMLLAKRLNESGLNIETAVYDHGWPADEKVFDGAAEVVMYCDGGGGHVIMKHMDEFNAMVKKGVGIGCIHYAVEVPKGDAGTALTTAIGGYFETFYSVNPHWTAEFKTLPTHPVTRGVKPFSTNDEWYYHMPLQREPRRRHTDSHCRSARQHAQRQGRRSRRQPGCARRSRQECHRARRLDLRPPEQWRTRLRLHRRSRALELEPGRFPQDDPERDCLDGGHRSSGQRC